MMLMNTWKDALPWKTPLHQAARLSSPEIVSWSSGKIQHGNVQLFTCPWGHIFMNPLYCSLISAALSEVFFPSAANIDPSSASFLLFLPGILLQRCQLLGFSRSLHSRRVYHYLGDGSYPLKDEVLHCRKRFHRMSWGLRVTQPSSTECWLFWLRHHRRTALAIINLFLLSQL